MMYLNYDGFQLEQSINFGQPKVTNKKGVEQYRTLPLLRVVDDKDLVPLIPPENLLDIVHGAYEHLGKEIIPLKEQYYVILDEHKAEAVSIGSFWHNLGHEDIPGHYMNNYIEHKRHKFDQSIAVDYHLRHQYG